MTIQAPSRCRFLIAVLVTVAGAVAAIARQHGAACGPALRRCDGRAVAACVWKTPGLNGQIEPSDTPRVFAWFNYAGADAVLVASRRRYRRYKSGRRRRAGATKK